MSAHPNSEFIHALADGQTVECWLEGDPPDDWTPLSDASSSASDQLLYPQRWQGLMYQYRIKEAPCTPT